MTTPYDQVPYPARMHPQAHPDRLATMGRLFGLETPPLETCRVLELGCGEGGNLIPAAFSLPGARFLGIDLSQTAVANAAVAARGLNLTNVDVRAMDIRDFPADAGAFDYIVAHGVYSWVPADVRERLLAICRDHLAPSGVAYVSFNTYPGYRLREIAREAIRFRPNGNTPVPSDDPVGGARARLKVIADGACGDDAYNAVVRAERARLDEVDDRVLFHDDLAECNAPVYFEQFAADAARYGLQYLSDADYSETADRPARPGLALRLDRLTGGSDDVVAREQYADFLVGRAFRRTLLCHAAARLSRPARPESLKGMRVSAQVRPLNSEPDASDKVRRFKTHKGMTLSTNHPAAAAALRLLGEAWPRSIPFDELLRATGTADGVASRTELGGFLLTAAAGGAVELSLHAPAFATEPGERPLASPLARQQASGGADLVTTLTRGNVKLEGAWARELLLLLDGTRDRAALVEALAARVAAGHLAPPSPSALAPDALHRVLREGLESKLAQLARLGLLMR